MSPLSCPDVEELAPELALGTLPGDQRSAVLAHLDGCTDCRRLLNKLSDTADSLLLMAPEVEPPPGFTRRVMAGLKPAQRRRWRLVALAAAAALLLADDRVLGIAPGDRLADEALDLAIHRGDDIVSSLERRCGLAECRVRECACFAREAGSEFESTHC